MFTHFTLRNVLLNSKQQKKMIGHVTHFRENEDLPLWPGPAVKKKPPFFNAPSTFSGNEVMRIKNIIE